MGLGFESGWVAIGPIKTQSTDGICELTPNSSLDIKRTCRAVEKVYGAGGLNSITTGGAGGQSASMSRKEPILCKFCKGIKGPFDIRYLLDYVEDGGAMNVEEGRRKRKRKSLFMEGLTVCCRFEVVTLRKASLVMPR